MSKKRSDEGITKHLSCQRCRIRKIKCIQEHPCASCIKAGVECVPVTDDKRSKRPAANYVTELEIHIAKLQSIWERVKGATPSEREKLLSSVTDFLKVPSRKIKTEDLQHREMDIPNSATAAASARSSGSSSTKPDNSVYGPTSVYHNDLITNPTLHLKHDDSTIKSLNKDPDILHCIKTFFTWQYPDHNMFLFREAFLIDFFNPKPNSLYCSKALILSICALGSRMSEIDRIYDKSHLYYTEARSLLLSKLDHPLITSLQGFLLLSFYDICNGSNSSSWMLSGNAFRMGYDIGFQLNPSVWFMKSRDGDNKLSNLDIAIRSRIYWGSYMADHFISLLLGRPSLLKMSEASIPETDYLPDLEWIDEFMYQDPTNKHKVKEEMSNISLPLKNIIKLINISDSMLTDIFTRSEAETADTDEDLDISSRLEKLSQYNNKIMKWKEELPKDLSWDRELLGKSGDNPIFQCIRYYYYILILCLNRPFIGVVSKKNSNHTSSSRPLPSDICEAAIGDLHKGISRFQEVHGLRKASIFIVYCSILAISVLLLTNTSKQLVDDKKIKLDFFMNVLKRCSKTWNLAEKSYKLIKIKLKSLREEEESNNSNVQSTNAFTNQSFAMPRAQSPDIKVEDSAPQYGVASPRTYNINRRTSIAFLNELTKEKEIENVNYQILNNHIHMPQNHLNESFAQTLNNTNTNIQGQPNAPTNNSPSDIKTASSLEADENLDFFGGPPVLMTSDLFNEDWESLFPDYIFNPHN